MNPEQESEWLEAQRITISKDLFPIVKQHLLFLETVDKNRSLYGGPVLNRAIHRYKNCWLPLLAKHNESPLLSGPLVVPFDCEWIWHCHRLNPLQYKIDCEQFYGRILDNHNVRSTVKGPSMQECAELWSRMYPEEPYELDLIFSKEDYNVEGVPGNASQIKYDLVSAVKRQSTFAYQVARPCTRDARFLIGAIERYKGFIHLIRRNREKSLKRFCVPTYDVDLIWHSHQLQPVCYNKDLVELLGRVLEHDDTDSDRTKGKKLDTGFTGTTQQWEEIYGTRYWRAGAMHKGNAPSPVVHTPYIVHNKKAHVTVSGKYKDFLPITQLKNVQVLMEIIGVKDLPPNNMGTVFVRCSKSPSDVYFNVDREIGIFSVTGQKQVATFLCEPHGELIFEVVSRSLPGKPKLLSIGTASINVEALINSNSLMVDQWLELSTTNVDGASKPSYLRVYASATVPVIAPQVLRMVQARQHAANSCFYQLVGRIQRLKNWTEVIDHTGSPIVTTQIRRSSSGLGRELLGISGSSEDEVVLCNEIIDSSKSLIKWSILDSSWFLKLDKRSGANGHTIELQGDRVVKFFPGRRLEFELENFRNKKSEADFLTAVEFSPEDPYGKALALFNFRNGVIKVNEEWFMLLGIILHMILSDVLRKEGCKGLVNVQTDGSEVNNTDSLPTQNTTQVEPLQVKDETTGSGSANRDIVVSNNTTKSREFGGFSEGSGNASKSSACGDCGAGCADVIEKDPTCGRKCGGGCGGGCGSGCGNTVKAGGGCGGCGSGCGNVMKVGGGCGECGGECGIVLAPGMGGAGVKASAEGQ